MSKTVEFITLGGGCFWCLDAVFGHVRGVLSVESGYCNGQQPYPTYEQVCSGRTGHVEVVRLGFDPAVVSLRTLLEIFFHIHDPTTLNRQGQNVGTQYRSGIYFERPQEQAVAISVLEEVQHELNAKVVTEVLPLSQYFPAEAYHQHYFSKHPGQGYCTGVIGPKVEKFKKTFADWVRPS
jgi:peptide-methionine (S)-S-oxide reductase